MRVLLIELEEARGNHVVHEEELSSTDISSTSEVISQHLVSFRSIEELQKQNQRLLVALRELSDAQEKEESEISRNKCVGLIYSNLICVYRQKCQLFMIFGWRVLPKVRWLITKWKRGTQLQTDWLPVLVTELVIWNRVCWKPRLNWTHYESNASSMSRWLRPSWSRGTHIVCSWLRQLQSTYLHKVTGIK